MFTSFYITDSNRNLIFEYLTSSFAPTFKQINHKIAKQQENNGNNASVVRVSRDVALYGHFSSVNRLYYWALCEQCDDPLKPLVFLSRFDGLLMEYFDRDVLTATKLMNNQDRLALLLNSIIDAGEIVMSDTNKLRYLLPLHTDLSTVFSSATKTLTRTIKNRESSNFLGSSNSSNINGGPTINRSSDSPLDAQVVPWRIPNLSNVNNEIYVDMVETLTLNLKQSRPNSFHVFHGVISGKIDLKCYLRGNPTMQINLHSAGHAFKPSALHRCLDPSSSSFDSSSLRFIPPDGKFTLLEYTIDLDEMHNNSKKLANIGLVTPSLTTHLGPKKDEFEIKCSIGNTTHTESIEDLRIVAYFPDRRNHTDEAKIKILRNTHGGWQTNLTNTTGSWILDKNTPVGSIPVLRGCVEQPEPSVSLASSNSSLDSILASTTATSAAAAANTKTTTHSSSSSPPTIPPAPTAAPIFPTHLSLSYTNHGQLPSGIRIQSVNILSGLPKGTPFKGVKYTTRAENVLVRP
ncbi:Apm3p Ecym_7266 [Eremothecium cymbalariae DBVPG|uniref:MHD domain-containing protein n=1 Tax=Eremothecium cymbalariae (strain CBS 270.75 / DBVPG 7215 / KCTC 17166 / NRRL Y-17582) TaxID=931890 RepID=G8JW95_ERECY|nr:hypothetical protein Ecym_7266 [Eremothecium cymbalariae DBVPG\